MFRVRVKVNDLEPLSGGTWVQYGQGHAYWVEFKYERLGIIAINVVVLLTLKGHVGANLVRGGKVLV